MALSCAQSEPLLALVCAAALPVGAPATGRWGETSWACTSCEKVRDAASKITKKTADARVRELAKISKAFGFEELGKAGIDISRWREVIGEDGRIDLGNFMGTAIGLNDVDGH